MVRAWLNARLAKLLYLSSATLAELLFSIIAGIAAARGFAVATRVAVAGLTVFNSWVAGGGYEEQSFAEYRLFLAAMAVQPCALIQNRVFCLWFPWIGDDPASSSR